ncbi:hypothetical protein LAV88_29330 [Rhizobium sp. VS19-DR104.1]|uniref:hypothetical protein n=2 Tax=Rhizobium TaxID=379 RepID=UPI001EB6BD57|nr:hypothetical protein [Rhizobium sp. L51/94]MBZ5845073.1 hypothetical protein [Rhizobium sp. VS19-DR104.1]
MSEDDENETEAMSRDLIWILSLIVNSRPEERQRIALAYAQAQDLVASISKDNGDAWPRIVACFERSDAYQAAGDPACAGWLLTGMQERVNERNLPDWRKLRKIIRNTIKRLPLTMPTVH